MKMIYVVVLIVRVAYVVPLRYHPWKWLSCGTQGTLAPHFYFL